MRNGNVNQTPQTARAHALFEEIFSAATQSASRSMQGWTSGQISLTLDEVGEIPLEEVSSQLDVGDELLTIIVLSLQGALGGQIILTFDDANGRQLAATLLNRESSTEGEWTPLEVSALKETGNILACAYVHHVSEVVGQKLIPSPPHFMQDFGASVLEQAVMMQAMVCDRVLVCRTSFRRNDDELNWRVFFVPDQTLLTEIYKSLESAV